MLLLENVHGINSVSQFSKPG